MPRLIQVIQSDVPRGKGTPVDRCRIVQQYHTPEGDLLAEYDPQEPPEHRWLGEVTIMPQRPSPALLGAIDAALDAASEVSAALVYDVIYEALAERPTIAELRD